MLLFPRQTIALNVLLGVQTLIATPQPDVLHVLLDSTLNVAMQGSVWHVLLAVFHPSLLARA